MLPELSDQSPAKPGDPRSESIAVIIPVYNGAAYLEQALQSVLAQTVPASEILLIDDGSKDNSVEIARRFDRIRVIPQANAGVCATRNRGVELTSSEWIAFLDQDDVYQPDKLERQLDAIRAKPDADVCVCGSLGLNQVGDTDQFEQAGIFLPPESERIGPELYDELRLQPGLFMVRRSAFLRAGGFDLASTPCEDWDLLLRLEQTGARFVACRLPLLQYRTHSAMNSNNAWKMYRAEKRVYELRIAPHTRWWARPFSRLYMESAFLMGVALVQRYMRQPHLGIMLRSIATWPFGHWRRYRIVIHMMLTKIGVIRPA